jgi:centromeric protein E
MRSHSRSGSTPIALPSILPAAAKRFKAAISLEARQRIKSPLSTVSAPKSLTANDAPKSPRLQNDVKKTSDESKMDVSRVDPEDVLLDYSNIEMGDADHSAELDESILKGLDHKEDKVMVSVRYEPPLTSFFYRP